VSAAGGFNVESRCILCDRLRDMAVREARDDHSDYSNQAAALTNGGNKAEASSGSDLTEEQLNELLELMPMDQRDALLMDDYLSLPHLK
jgi:hypothetical protein